jgi:hypothetical protein
MASTALKLEAEVDADGHIDLRVPLPEETRVTVFVIQDPVDDFEELVRAAESSLDFWDNPYDDEGWNRA